MLYLEHESFSHCSPLGNLPRIQTCCIIYANSAMFKHPSFRTVLAGPSKSPTQPTYSTWSCSSHNRLFTLLCINPSIAFTEQWNVLSSSSTAGYSKGRKGATTNYQLLRSNNLLHSIHSLVSKFPWMNLIVTVKQEIKHFNINY